jgi:hypothetical protein
MRGRDATGLAAGNAPYRAARPRSLRTGPRPGQVRRRAYGRSSAYSG